MVATTESPSDFAIDLHHVEKVYRGRVHALRGVTMRVYRGEIFGLLGPNGAGKSTLVKIMMTVIRPTRAEGTVLSRGIGHKPTLAKIGYLPEHHRFPRYLTGRQAIDFYGALANVNRTARKARTEELLELVGMTDWRNKRISSYSKGMMQRIGLAQALINDPELIVLDEPTDGVDPVGRREIRDILLSLKRRGKTIFLNSHLLSELEMVCDRVAIMVQGLVTMQGTLDDLTHDSQRYEIIIEGDAPAWISPDDDLQARKHGENRTCITMLGTDPTPAQPIVDRLRRENRLIVSMRPVRETLEDLFMRAVTDPTTGKTKKIGALSGKESTE